LRALNPAATLQRGYSVVQKRDGKQAISSKTQIKPGEQLDIYVADGHFPASVSKQYGF
jgi:exonuclease VII large subunit